MTPKRLAWHMDNWASWISAPVDDGDYPSRAGGGLGHSSARDFDAMCAEADTACARAVQAILDGLAPRLRLTVYMRHGIMDAERVPAVYRVRGDVEANYDEALGLVESGLLRRGVQ